MTELALRWGVAASSMRRPERGTNNLVSIIDDRYVLRVYRNLEIDHVEREHRLLEALVAAGASFAVPVALATLEGETIVPTSDGPAAMYELLPGEPVQPNDEHTFLRLGAALGEMMDVLSRLPRDLAPANWRAPLSGVHPAVPDVADLVDELRRVAPDASGLDVFAETWAETDRRYLELDLPCQICHLDFAPGNVLIDGGRVTAIIDWEIAGWDIRVNDYVAGLVQSTDRRDEEEAFARGFASRFTLSEAEWDAVPTLRHLRLLATAVWRAGRWRDGKATLDEVRTRLAALA